MLCDLGGRSKWSMFGLQVRGPPISEPSGSHHTVKMPQTLLGKGYLTAG